MAYTNSLLPPIFKFVIFQSMGGGMAPCVLSYASDSGVARICQRGSEATERGEGVALPRLGDLKCCISKQHFLLAHVIITVVNVVA